MEVLKEKKEEKKEVIPLVYKKMCPNCLGDICSERLEKGLPCKRCLPEEVAVDEVGML